MVCACGSFCCRHLTGRALFCYYKSSRSSGIFACSLHFVYIESERSTTDRKDPCLLDQAIATVVVIVQMTMAILGQAMQGAVRHVMALAIYAVVKHQCAYCKPAVNTLLTFLVAGNVSQQGLRRVTKSSFQVQLLTILRCGIKKRNNHIEVAVVRSSFSFAHTFVAYRRDSLHATSRILYPLQSFLRNPLRGRIVRARRSEVSLRLLSKKWLVALRLVVCSVLCGIPDTLSAPLPICCKSSFCCMSTRAMSSLLLCRFRY